MSIKCPNALSIFRSPHRGDVILGCCEEEVAVIIEFDDGDGTFVPFE
jgi:hypothetical protein